jgi:hypothetical protein
MNYLEKIYSKSDSIVSRKIADEFILVPIRRKLADVNSIYLLQDDVSVRIWKLIDGQRPVGKIKKIICEEFDVSPEQAQSDLVEFLKQLEKIGEIIGEVSEKGKSLK